MAVGDRVLAMPWLGGFASHVELAAGGRRPDPGRPVLRAGRRAGAELRHDAVRHHPRTQVREGEWVLVLGAGGGIGLAAVDVARHLGARVIAAASSDDKLAAARAAGAEATIAYETEDLKARAREISGGGVDVVVDPGRRPLRRSRAAGAGLDGSLPRDRLRRRRDPPAAGQPGAAQQPHGRRASTGARGRCATPAGNQELLAELMALAGSGALSPVEPTGYPLDDVVSALTDLQEREVAGKVVLVP